MKVYANNPRLLTILSCAVFGVLAPMTLAGELPGTGGKLDFGVDGLTIPPLIRTNGISARAVTLTADLEEHDTVMFQRIGHISELGASRRPEALTALASALSAPQPSVRAAAAQALATLCEESDIAATSRAAVRADAAIGRRLTELLKDPDDQVRCSALRALVAFQGKPGPAVTAALQAPDDHALYAAAIELAGTPEQAQILMVRISTLPVAQQIRALEAVGRCKAVAQVPAVCAVTSTPDVAVVVASCQTLSLLGSEQAAPTLHQLCAHTHPSVRREAIRALAHCEQPARIRSRAMAMLKDEDPTVRQGAVEALGIALAPEAVAPVAEQLGTDYVPLYEAARAALISAKDDATRQQCITVAGDLLENSNVRRREDGSYVLGAYRSDYKLQQHLVLLNPEAPGNDWSAVAQACESLGLIGRKEAIPGVREVALPANGSAMGALPAQNQARTNALVAAGRLVIPEVVPTAVRVLQADPKMSDPRQRAAAAFAIGVLATPDSDAANELYGVIGGMMESGWAKREAVKALGNLKVPGAPPRIASFQMSDEPQTHYMIEWATARITNTPEKHVSVTAPWTIQLSVMDLVGQ